MSTAFMVDNILQDKDSDHIHDSFTSGCSDSESEPTSDHKDSICCDSPPPSYHLNPNSQDTDELLQSYRVMRGNGNVTHRLNAATHVDDDDDEDVDDNMVINDDNSSNNRDNNEEAIIMDSSGDDAILLAASDTNENNDDNGIGTKLCCGKCGNLQFGNKTIIDNEIQYEFKCDKCGSCDYYVKVAMQCPTINAKTTTTQTMLNMDKTLLKDSNVVVNHNNNNKPVLKFSVSAILGERKDCVKVRNEFIQPQHLWPYIQQNLIQQNHLVNSNTFIGNHHHHHHHHHHHNGNSNQQNHLSPTTNGVNNCNNNNNNDNCVQQQQQGGHHPNRNSSPITMNVNGENNETNPISGRDNKIIAKPLPSRPGPPPSFLAAAAAHHGLNHPHLHSLLAHCRNPYMGGAGPQVFPLPPGQGFPWAHSTRGKPRRGMMRRAVFSDSQRKGLEKRFQIQKYISKPDRKKLAERLGLKDSQVCLHIFTYTI
uniref:CSON004317 protein n=1 Tax=Culicoides sonorensis TaxID=179676 RepID=A0A336MTA7_CULSO